jgi:hypothetical protein
MMMSPANDRESPLNQHQMDWAREELGLDATAGQADARRAFLTQVADGDFAPNLTKLHAFEILRCESQPPCSPASRGAERLRTKERVERFAERVFMLSPSERRSEWEALQACSKESPAAVAVLERLRPALNLDVERLQLDSDSKELTDHLCELFSLPPVKRAERRAAIIELCKSDMQRWERVAKSIASRHPNIAALDPPLVEQLSTWSRTEKVMRKPPQIKGAPQIKVSKRFWNEDLSQHGWLIAVVLIVLANVGRLATTTSSSTRSPPTPTRSTPAYRSPSQTGEAIRVQEMFKRLEQMQSQIKSPPNDADPNTRPNRIRLLPPNVNEQSESADVHQRIGEVYIQDQASSTPSAAPYVPREAEKP